MPFHDSEVGINVACLINIQLNMYNALTSSAWKNCSANRIINHSNIVFAIMFGDARGSNIAFFSLEPIKHKLFSII